MNPGCANCDLILHVQEVEEVNVCGLFMPCGATFRCKRLQEIPVE